MVDKSLTELSQMSKHELIDYIYYQDAIHSGLNQNFMDQLKLTDQEKTAINLNEYVFLEYLSDLENHPLLVVIDRLLKLSGEGLYKQLGLSDEE